MSNTLKSDKFIGYFFGCISAISYGLIPLFSMPMFELLKEPGTEHGDVYSVLFYRYIFGFLSMGLLMLVQKHRLLPRKVEFIPLLVMAVLFACSSIFLFASYNYMPTSIASTILFCYPVLVALIQVAFFNEKVSLIKIVAITLALAGILLLYRGDGEITLSTTGMLMVVLSSLAYAIYIVGVGRSALKQMSVTRLTFYVTLIGMVIFFACTGFGSHLQPMTDSSLWINAMFLGIFPTSLSLLGLAIASRKIGATNAAILGALEPVTAVFFGVTILGDSFTFALGCGIALVISAVMLLILNK